MLSPNPDRPILILAAGEASRFDGAGSKQHVEIAGERVIDRIVRQCRARGGDPLLIQRAGQPDFAAAPRADIDPTETTCGGILNTAPHWGAVATVFLLSDVHYTDDAMDRVLAPGPTAFFTDGQDIFALRLAAADYPTLRLVAQLADHLGVNQGRIWEAYRRWHGLEQWPVRSQSGKPLLEFIGDATQDFDCRRDVDDFLAGISKNILHRPPSDRVGQHEIDTIYHELLSAPTDMRAHLPMLHALAHGRRVTEFGTRRGISTCALVAGRPLSLTCYDLKKEPDVDRIARWAAEAGVPFHFHEQNLEGVRRIAETDLLFIDAMHNGPAVREYLALGLGAGMSACALHDTEIFGRAGDVKGTNGIMDAVDEFLRENRLWRITHQSQRDCGFTVIERKRPRPSDT